MPQRNSSGRAAEPAGSLDVLVDREVDALDRLAADVRAGIRSPRRFDELEAAADAIGERLRAAFRGGRRR